MEQLRAKSLLLGPAGTGPEKPCGPPLGWMRGFFLVGVVLLRSPLQEEQKRFTKRLALVMRSNVVILFVILTAISTTVSKNLEAAPLLKASNTTQPGVLRVHGCHRNWEEGWSNALGGYLVHRHGNNCRPKAYEPEYFDDDDWPRRGPPSGWRRYDYDRGGPPPGWRRYNRDGWD